MYYSIFFLVEFFSSESLIWTNQLWIFAFLTAAWLCGVVHQNLKLPMQIKGRMNGLIMLHK